MGKPRFQFSLRSVFLVVTAAGVLIVGGSRLYQDWYYRMRREKARNNPIPRTPRQVHVQLQSAKSK